MPYFSRVGKRFGEYALLLARVSSSILLLKSHTDFTRLSWLFVCSLINSVIESAVLTKLSKVTSLWADMANSMSGGNLWRNNGQITSVMHASAKVCRYHRNFCYLEGTLGFLSCYFIVLKTRNRKTKRVDRRLRLVSEWYQRWQLLSYCRQIRRYRLLGHLIE